MIEDTKKRVVIDQLHNNNGHLLELTFVTKSSAFKKVDKDLQKQVREK